MRGRQRECWCRLAGVIAGRVALDQIPGIARIVTDEFIERNRRRILEFIVDDRRNVVIDIDGHMAIDCVEVVVSRRVRELNMEIVLELEGAMTVSPIVIERVRERRVQRESVGTIGLNGQIEDVKCPKALIVFIDECRTGQRTAAAESIGPLDVDIALRADAIAVDIDCVELGKRESGRHGHW